MKNTNDPLDEKIIHSLTKFLSSVTKDNLSLKNIISSYNMVIKSNIKNWSLILKEIVEMIPHGPNPTLILIRSLHSVIKTFSSQNYNSMVDEISSLVDNVRTHQTYMSKQHEIDKSHMENITKQFNTLTSATFSLMEQYERRILELSNPNQRPLYAVAPKSRPTTSSTGVQDIQIPTKFTLEPSTQHF